MDKLARIMEGFWLVAAIAGTIWAGVQVYVHGWPASTVYIWFPLVCVAMFFYRRFTRKKMAEWAERKAREQEQRQ